MGKAHTKEEISWATEIINKKLHGAASSVSTIEKLGLSTEYQKKFSKNLKPSGMYTWFKGIVYPEKYGYEARKKRAEERKERLGNNSSLPRQSKNPLKVFLKSNFIVVAPPNFVSGFETEEEVKTFLQQSQILNGVKLFVSKAISIKFDIKIGE